MMTEAQHQSAVFKWSRQPQIRQEYPELALMYHIPNEGKRSGRTANNLKQQGLKSGVPDICLPVARGGFSSLYIELKAEKGCVTPNQQWWIDTLRRFGCCVSLCYGWEEATSLIHKYLDGERAAEC